MDKSFENIMCEFMTGYRWIPLLYTIASQDEYDSKVEAAWTDLLRILQSELPDMSLKDLKQHVRKFAKAYEGWIVYALADMSLFAEKLIFNAADEAMEDIRFEAYTKIMKAQALLLSNKPQIFKVTGIDCIRILDIGCGPFSYFKHFNCANTNLVEYIGIDKRNMTKDITNATDDTRVSFYQRNILEVDAIHIANRANVLFMGNFLHCLASEEEMLEVLKKILSECTKIKNILILEPNLDHKGIGAAFGYHMEIHGGTCVDELTIESLALKLHKNPVVIYTGPQYIMYELT